jgi:hypothetical protein
VSLHYFFKPDFHKQYEINATGDDKNKKQKQQKTATTTTKTTTTTLSFLQFVISTW